MKKIAFGIVAMAAVALLSADTANAQSGAFCQAKGSADLRDGGIKGNAGFGGPATFSNLTFNFSGILSNCQAMPGTPKISRICTIGSVSDATCGNNAHEGNFVLCTGGCDIYERDEDGKPVDNDGDGQLDLLAAPVCLSGAPVLSGHLSGNCVGSACIGTDGAGMTYQLLFDQATVEAATSECGPTATGGLNKASFDGGLGFMK